MSHSGLLIFVAAILLSVPCQADQTNIFGSRSNIALIASPKTVEAWRTLGSLKSAKNPLDPLDDYRATGRAVMLPTNLVMQISKTLLDEKSYWVSSVSAKYCMIRPGVLLTFSDGGQALDVYLCFECDALIVAAGKDQQGGPIKIGVGDFDPARATLVKIVKQLFPNDSQIQELKETR